MQTRPQPKRYRKTTSGPRCQRRQAGPVAGAVPGDPPPAGHREGHAPVHAAQRLLFEVNPRATKTEIKQAVEDLFNVKVDDVRTQNRRASSAAIALKVGRMPNWKKAIVTLHGDDRIDSSKMTWHRWIVDRERQADARATSRDARFTTWVFATTNRRPPAARHGSVSDFAELTDKKKKPGKVADRAAQEEGRPEQPGLHHRPAPRRRPQADVPHHRLQAQDRTARRRPYVSSSTTRTARPGSPWSSTTTARSAYIIAPEGLKAGMTRSPAAATPSRRSATACRCRGSRPA